VRATILRWRVLALVLTVAAGAVLVSCGGGDDSGGDSGSQSASLRLFSYDDATQSKKMQGVLDSFKQANPNITVKYDTLPGSGAAVYPDKLRTELLGGSGPDTFRIWGGEIGRPFITSKQAADISEYYKKYGWDEKIAKSAIDAMSVGGRQYGVPMLAASIGVYYRKDIFKKVGVDVPKTYAELEAVNDKLVKAGYVPVATGGKFGWDPMRVFEYLLEHTAGPQLHDALLQRKENWNRPEVVQAFALFKKWVDRKWFNEGFLPLVPDDADTMLTQGKAAMLFTGQWEEGNIAAAKQDPQKYGTFIPPTDQEPLRYSGFVEGFMISESSKNKDAAAKLLDYLVSPGQPPKAGYQYTPVLSDKPDATEFPLAAQWAQWQTEHANYTIQDQAFAKELADAYFQIQSDVTQGKQSPEQAAASMQKAVEASGG
jgi:raffinose/stachyose/melibiose transport system substrate-binding protein